MLGITKDESERMKRTNAWQKNYGNREKALLMILFLLALPIMGLFKIFIIWPAKMLEGLLRFIEYQLR